MGSAERLDSERVRRALTDHVAQLPFFDTHSHLGGMDLGSPVDDRQGMSLPQLISHDYLAYLGGSCCDERLVLRPVESPFTIEMAEAHYRSIEPALDHYRALGTWATLREGIRALHPFDEDDITRANFAAINRSVVRAYTTHGLRKMQRLACRHAGIVKQNHMCLFPYMVDHLGSLPPEERHAQMQLLAPALIIDGFFFAGLSQNVAALARTCEILGVQPTTHRQHIDLCARALDRFIKEGGASVKLLFAYTRSIHLEHVSDSVAAPLFEMPRDRLTNEQLRLLQDNLAWHALRLANDRDLPLIVHTGYATPTEWGHPENLLPIFKAPETAGMNVDLCHSGWPNEGAAMIMARTYRQCYFNLCWTPMLSPTLGKRILHEAIDIIPLNKILLGTDVATAEHLVGVTQLIRQQVVDVLMEKMSAGQFGLDVAKRAAAALLCDNAEGFYGMKPGQMRQAAARPAPEVVISPAAVHAQGKRD